VLIVIDRTIESAVLAETGEVLCASKVFKTEESAYRWREQYQTGNAKFYCQECGGELGVSSNKTDAGFRTHYFFHKRGGTGCVLDSRVPNKNTREINRVLGFRESARHKQLKRELSTRLKKTKGVKKSSVKEEKWIIINDRLERRPDVSCIYNEKEIVFEIQLSVLPLKYMLQRHVFYRDQGIYLIWLLEDFDPKSKSIFIIDVQYLHKHQNFFRLDESKMDFHLICKYKQVFLNKAKDVAVHTQWTERSIAWDRIQFDETNHQVFHYNFVKELREKESQKEEYLLKLEKERQERIKRDEEKVEANHLHSINEQVQDFLSDLKELFSNNSFTLYGQLNEKSLKIGREVMRGVSAGINLDAILKDNKYPFLIDLLLKPKLEKRSYFLKLVFESHWIHFDVHMGGNKDFTLLQALLNDDDIHGLRFTLIKSLFKKRYKATVQEREEIKSMANSEFIDINYKRTLLLILHFCDTNWSDIEELDKKEMLFFGLLSLKKRELYGFSKKQGINWLINYLIDHHSENGDVLLKAIDTYCEESTIKSKKSTTDKVSMLRERVLFDSKNSSWLRILQNNLSELGFKL
tara:strand:- start:1205 stop:2938 length:1734 start_codon:yes stop_codon:yes gene_type:complete